LEFVEAICHRAIMRKTVALVILMGVPLARSIPVAPAVTAPAIVPLGAYQAGLACAPPSTLRALRGGGIQSPSPPAAPAKYVPVPLCL
jgi:hypothetical protein